MFKLNNNYHASAITDEGVKMVQAYTVWVGGGEVNTYYLDKDNAERLAKEYINDGYTDVIIEEV